MSKNNTAIRLSITDDVDRALELAKKAYPALSYPEILKLGLSRLVTEMDERLTAERETIAKSASYAVGYDYLSDPKEDIYSEEVATG